jgi:hypothetical protein
MSSRSRVVLNLDFAFPICHTEAEKAETFIRLPSLSFFYLLA